jgi:transposase, IS30 family
MSEYRRLTERDRDRIETFLDLGISKREIADRLGVHRCTITRETNKFTGHYRSDVSQYWARLKASRRRGPRKLASNKKLLAYVRRKLKLRWSPEQISSSLKKRFPDQPNEQISYESIYTYIYLLPRGELKKELLKGLRLGRVKRKRRGTRTMANREVIADMISIEERPAEVGDRSVAGHWEADLLVGKGHKSVLGSIVERKTRSVILVPLKSKDATVVRKAFERELLSLPRQMRKTVTYDQGKEMAEHKLFTKNTKIKVYFCDPASPWQRGTNENTNMLIRDFFKKGTDFSKLSRYQIKRVQKLLNERPRKLLDWQTPKEVFEKEVLDQCK